ncbi:MAG: hypothetical protein ACRDNI_05865 [Gaiellaceae bacterium]
MRRVALVFALTLAALLPLGCAGPEGQRAQELLAQSDQALAEVRSMRFSGRLWMETPLGDFAFVMSGAGTTKGGGASYMTMSSPDVPEFPEMSVVVRGQNAWMKAGGRWQQTTVPPQSATGIEQFDFTPYVKDVDVDDGHQVGGEPAVKVTGVLDTTALVNGLFGQLGSVPGGAVPDLSEAFDDTRIVLYISETSHLPLRTLVDMSVEAAGERVEMHMDFALSGVNEPVKIPRVRG